ncbi:MAG: hypothetical protein JNK75_13735 [Betaproteobacteria bacterium]|nr:hypothetical protein [Betaproteobacteria bacterium]
MDPERELASKVDALVGRHSTVKRPGDQVDDRNVPVLTDMVSAPEWSPPASEGTPLAGMSDAALDALSQEIFTRVYGKIDRDLAHKIEDRIAAAMANHINVAITDVITDMRQEIANEIGDAVNAALADQLRRK